MDDETLQLLAALIRGRRIAALGTLRQGAPFVSMVPYAPAADFSAFYLHMSRLAYHTQDILKDAQVSRRRWPGCRSGVRRWRSAATTRLIQDSRRSTWPAFLRPV
jgi:hypothetical protein